MNATETDLRESLDLSATLQCEVVTVFISNHDFQVTRFGDQCPNPAEWVGKFHRPTLHDRVETHLCGEHKDRFAGAVCINPVCCAPRLIDVRPI